MSDFMFQKGDMVYVVDSPSELDKIRGEHSNLHIPEMDKFCGKIATVLRRGNYNGDEGNAYKLRCTEGDFGEWWFHEEHLSLVGDDEVFGSVSDDAIMKLVFGA